MHVLEMCFWIAGKDIYNDGMAQGMDKLDTASVCRVLEKRAGLKRD